MAASTSTATGARVDWYSLDATSVARELAVDPGRGLSADEARSRLGTTGPNRLTAAKKESGFQAFVRQYQDFMQIVLLVAAAINQLVTGDTATTVVLAGLTVFNAIIGLRQEAKAEESVKALAQMMKTVARVRRDGDVIEIDAGDLVPGDIVAGGGRQRRPCGRPDLRGRHPRDRRGGAHGGEPPGREERPSPCRAPMSPSATGRASPT